jgi:hypothetical protein
MYREKSSWRGGISLAIVAMLLSTWAMTSMLHARAGSSPFDVSGGYTFGNCKDPCIDYELKHVVECLDLTGSICETDRCTLNTLRFLYCRCPGDASPGADDCEYHYDSSDWWRAEYIRWHSCNSTTYKWELYKDKYCAKDGNGNSAWSTPCIWTGSCTGALWLYQEYKPRPRCD